jgi:methyltransferase (TIGR00027 family)
MQPIQTVSDTALWVAACRAAESERPGGILNDPLSGVLAGEKGRAILDATPSSDLMAFGVSLRVRTMDSLIEELSGNGEIDTVVDIGAGLDTRPYRLALPPSLRWFELDLPDLIAYKNECLRLREPNCLVERIAVDLNNEDARRRALAHAFRESHAAVVLTEGVLGYLSGDSARSLIGEVGESMAARWWIYDAGTRQAYLRIPSEIREQVDRVRSKDHVNHHELRAIFRERGWQITSEIPLSEAAARFATHRLAAMRFNTTAHVAEPRKEFWRVYQLGRI